MDNCIINKTEKANTQKFANSATDADNNKVKTSRHWLGRGSLLSKKKYP